MNKFFGSRRQSSREQVFWQSSPAGVSQLEGSAQVFWQSSPAGVSPGLLALDLAWASPAAPPVVPLRLRPVLAPQQPDQVARPSLAATKHTIAPAEDDVGGVPDADRKRGPGRGALGRRP